MRIAHLGLRSISPGCGGGVESHVRNLAPRLAALGHEVTVFCRRGYAEPTDPPPPSGVSVREKGCIRTKHLEAISHTTACLPATLKGFDIVHFHAMGPSLLCFVPRLAGARVVSTIHALDHERAKWGGFAKTVLGLGLASAGKFSNGIIAVSPHVAEGVRRATGREPAIIPNGVEPVKNRPLSRLTRFGLETNGYVLFLGRLVEEKGAADLIHAFRNLKTDKRLVVAGEGLHGDGHERELRRMAADDARIIFTGPLYGQDKEEAFSNASLFVMPSTLEGMPIALLEAASAGCPLLVSDIPPCLDVFMDGDEDMLRKRFHAGDAADLRRALGLALADPELPAMGRRAKEFVLERYTWDEAARRTHELYLSLRPKEGR